MGRLFRLGSAGTAAWIVVLLTASAIAASIPSSSASGTIRGCYNRSTGDLRVLVGSSNTCKAHEVPISWNQTGPQGPPAPHSLPVYAVVVAACGGGSNDLMYTDGGLDGTFSAPVGCQGTGFAMTQTWILPNPTSVVGSPIYEGTGTATCNPCTVGSLSGSLTFSLTLVAIAGFDSSGNITPGGILGGTWTIRGATGALKGLTGSGTYQQAAPAANGAGTAVVFSGRYSPPLA